MLCCFPTPVRMILPLSQGLHPLVGHEQVKEAIEQIYAIMCECRTQPPSAVLQVLSILLELFPIPALYVQ